MVCKFVVLVVVMNILLLRIFTFLVFDRCFMMYRYRILVENLSGDLLACSMWPTVELCNFWFKGWISRKCPNPSYRNYYTVKYEVA